MTCCTWKPAGRASSAWNVPGQKRTRTPTHGAALGSWTSTHTLGLVQSPLAAADVPSYTPPVELLNPARFAEVDPICESTGRFTLAHSQVRPLERLRQLCGAEVAVNGLFNNGNADLCGLLGRLHEFFRKEIELWAKTQIDGVALGDDLGWVGASREHLKMWRSLLKPLFQEYCKVLHDHDKFVFFLSEGTWARFWTTW